MDTSLAIVILNFNGKNHLETYLPSVLAYSKETPVFIADNASTDNSVSFIQKQFPQVHLLQQKRNFGFAGGYNVALEQIKGQFDYYLLLNSDVEVTEHWIEPLKEFMDTHENTAACQPKIMSWQNKHTFEHAGAAGGFVDLHYFPFCRGRIFDSLENDDQQ